MLADRLALPSTFSGEVLQVGAVTFRGHSHQPYDVEVVWSESDDGDAGWVAEVRDLPGCIAQGRSRHELLENIDRAVEAWIADALEAGDPIPWPR